jgi:hypothetical protein
MALPKDWQKWQEKTFVRAFDNPVLCTVSALLHITQRWVDLKLPPVHPLAIYTANGKSNGRVQLICELNINAVLQSAAKTVYNITIQEELSRFTSHSIRVGACITLHMAAIDPLDIKHALRWKSDSFLTYLQNLPCDVKHNVPLTP